MKTKSSKVQTNFHPILTQFLFAADALYIQWGDELIITSGSEPIKSHGPTSLHYATPAQAADIRIWDKEGYSRAEVPLAFTQRKELAGLAGDFCRAHKIPTAWIEIILESDHIHIEYQPKRPA